MSIVFAAAYLALVIAFALRGKRLAAAGVFLLGTAWLLYAPSLLDWLHHLGSDSFSEAQDFDFAEAVNFLQSLNHVTLRWQNLLATALTIAFGFTAILAAHGTVAILSRGRIGAASRQVLAVAAVLLIAPVALQVYPALRAFQSNSAIYRALQDNFHLHSEASVVRTGPDNKLNVVVYIGESTGSLNMSLYGYPRETTPELEQFAQQNNKLFVFDNVFSTHSHTTPSLLEALSVGVDAEQDYFPIHERHRVSVIDLLNQADIPSTLISNQARAGTWNEATAIVFRNAGDKEFSLDTTWLGTLEEWATRPLDHEFLIPVLDQRGALQAAGPKVIFLHSYAGHGPYLRNIDEAFRQPVDDLLETTPTAAILGDDLGRPARVLTSVEAFDSAVRYVDHNLVAVLQRVRDAPLPAVLMYFADHGEAVYAHRGHDSSRFIHEMARVPFLVYFNDAAARRHPDLVERFRDAADGHEISTLAQFPATLLSLFRLEVDGGYLQGVGLDAPDALPPILARETGAGYTYIPLGERRHHDEGGSGPLDAPDPHTELFRAARQLQDADTHLCQYRSHTLAKALRGAVAADCLWVGVAVDGDGEPAVHPTTAAPDGLDLDAVMDVARGYGRALWIAVEDADPVTACHALDAYLEADGLDATAGRDALDALIEFPAPWPLHEADFRTCLASLRARGFRTGLAVPVEFAASCARGTGDGPADPAACAERSVALRAAAASGLITDLAVEYSAAALPEALLQGIDLDWNVANVPLEQLESGQWSQFRLVAVELAHDPNDR